MERHEEARIELEPISRNVIDIDSDEVNPIQPEPGVDCRRAGNVAQIYMNFPFWLPAR